MPSKSREKGLLDVFPASLNFGEMFKVHGLGVLPILNDDVLQIIAPMLTLDEAFESRALSVHEINQSGVVKFLGIDNHGDKPVLLLDGEELDGGLHPLPRQSK